MQFPMPKRNELTVLEELCQKYGVKLGIAEEIVLNNMSNSEIDCVLRYELRKRMVQLGHRIDVLQRAAEREKYILENGGDHLKMKAAADLEDAQWQLKRARDERGYLETLPR